MNRVEVLGIGFDNLSREETIESCVKLIDKHASAYMVTPNPEIVMASWDNEGLKTAARNADLVISDGIGVVKAAKILGTPLKERLPGIEICEAVIERISHEGKSLYLLGAKPGVAEKAAENLVKKYPGLVIAGTQDGYFQDSEPVIEAINAAKPDFLMVCLGAPKQELWMYENAPKLDVGLMGGLGGSLDVFAGVTERAPKIWQKLGLEWLYRCLKEPWRFKRIARLPLFMTKAVETRIKKTKNE